MNKAVLLRLHRWIALAFSAPLLGIIATGLILSVEPLITARAVQPAKRRRWRVAGLGGARWAAAGAAGAPRALGRAPAGGDPPRD